MDLLDLLQLCDREFPTRKVKLVRHRDSDQDLELLLNTGHFEAYQAGQGREVFKGAERIVSFFAEAGTRSRFVGVYGVHGLVSRPRPLSVDYPYPDRRQSPLVYDLRKCSGFEDLEGRLVVDWGAGTRSWVQWLKSKEVIELLPRGPDGNAQHDGSPHTKVDLRYLISRERSDHIWPDG